MNKKFLSCFLSASLLLLLTSCYTLPPIVIYSSNESTTTNYTGTDVNVVVKTLQVTDMGYEGFNVEVTNNSSLPITINMAKSSISYTKSTLVPFITGMKFADAGTVPPSKTIPCGLTAQFAMYSPEQPYYKTGSESGGWAMQSIYIADNSPVTILLCIEVDEKSYYWTTTITANTN